MVFRTAWSVTGDSSSFRLFTSRFFSGLLSEALFTGFQLLGVFLIFVGLVLKPRHSPIKDCLQLAHCIIVDAVCGGKGSLNPFAKILCKECTKVYTSTQAHKFALNKFIIYLIK